MSVETPFLYRLAEDLKNRFGNKLDKITVVFNNKRPALFLKRYLSEVYGQAIISPQMLTIQEFLALSTEKAMANDLNRFFLLFKGYNQLLAEEGKTMVSPEFFYPLSTTLLSDFDQIDYDLVNPDNLYSLLKDIGEISKQFNDFTEEQQAFIAGFWSSFSAEKKSDVQQKFIELWQRLPGLYRLFNELLSREGLMNKATAYRRLAEDPEVSANFIASFEQVVFVGFNALNKCEATLFKQWQQADKALFYFDGDAHYFEDEMQEAGLFLRRNIQKHGLKNAMGDFPALLNNAQKAFFTYPVEGFTLQAKVLSQMLSREDSRDANLPDKRAVILADESLLVPCLQSIPEDSRINVTMGFPIKYSAVFHLLQLWLVFQEKLQTTGNKDFFFTEKDLREFIALGLPGFSTENKNEIFKEWLKAAPDDMAAIVTNYNKSTQLFFNKYNSGAACISGLQALVVFLFHHKSEAGNLKQIEGSLWLRVFQELNTLSDQLETFQKDLSLLLTLNLTRRYLSNLTTALAGEPLEGLQVMGMLESRSLDFDEIYILGANDGNLPHYSTVNSFIPDSLRRAFGLPLAEDKDALSAYLFYRLCQKAQKVHILYNSLVDNNSSGEISRFVRQLAFESNISFHHQSVAIASQPPQPLKSSIIEKTPEVQAMLMQYISDGKKRFSASSLKTYLDCPLQFFLKYVASLPDEDEILDPFHPIVQGNALHNTMQDFYTLFLESEQLIQAEDIKKRGAIVPDLCRKKLSAELPKHFYRGSKPDSRVKIAEEILIANVRLLLQHDEKNVAPFKVLGLEKKFDSSISLTLKEGEAPVEVNFIAFIDRIDERNGQVHIIDYKTGSDELKVRDIADLFSLEKATGKNSAALQALFYTFLYYKEKQVVPTPHLYILKKIQDEGTNFNFMTDKIQMGVFEKYLSLLIADIFNADINFEHNPDGKYCQYSTYAHLCLGDDILGEEENDDE